MGARSVVLVAADLFFVSKIAEAARAAEVTLIETSAGHALEVCSTTPPDFVIIDLHGPRDPIALAKELKADPATSAIPIVGYFSHVEREVGERASAAGVDLVLPRSAFTVRLPRLLAGDLPGR